MLRVILSILISLILASCASQPPAPIEYPDGSAESGSGYLSRTVDSISYDDKIVESDIKVDQSSPYGNNSGILKDPNEKDKYNQDEFVLPNQRAEPERVIYHEVELGETLEQIAKDYNQNVLDLAKFNELEPPYHVEEFDMIKVKVSSSFLNKKNKENARSLLGENKVQETKQEVAAETSFIRPVDGTIIVDFGAPTKTGENKGVNIAANLGSRIKAVTDGEVVHSDYDQRFGNLIIIKSKENGLYIAYAHMEDLILPKGAFVKQGETIGYVGNSGNVKSAQLYFAMKKGSTAVDPVKYIPSLK